MKTQTQISENTVVAIVLGTIILTLTQRQYAADSTTLITIYGGLIALLAISWSINKINVALSSISLGWAVIGIAMIIEGSNQLWLMLGSYILGISPWIFLFNKEKWESRVPLAYAETMGSAFLIGAIATAICAAIVWDIELSLLSWIIALARTGAWLSSLGSKGNSR